MHSVLLVIDKPAQAGQRNAWNALLSDLRSIVWSEIEGKILGEIALVIPVENGRSILEQAEKAADREGFEHHALFFDQDSDQ